jgi:hypothetical protein
LILLIRSDLPRRVVTFEITQQMSRVLECVPEGGSASLLAEGLSSDKLQPGDARG